MAKERNNQDLSINIIKDLLLEIKKNNELLRELLEAMAKGKLPKEPK